MRELAELQAYVRSSSAELTQLLLTTPDAEQVCLSRAPRADIVSYLTLPFPSGNNVKTSTDASGNCSSLGADSVYLLVKV